MAKYHINQNTGKVALCKAEDGRCPITRETGEPHFETREEAEQRYEQIQEDKGLNFQKLRKESKKDFSENNQEKIVDLLNDMKENFRSGDQFSVGDTTYTRVHEKDMEGGEKIKLFESKVFNPLNQAHIVVERNVYTEKVSAYLNYDKGNYCLSDSDEFSASDINTKMARILLKADRIFHENYAEEMKPDPELLENYNEMLELSENGDHSYSQSGDMPIPGYVERFEQTCYVAPEQYMGSLPNGRTLTIDYENNYVQAIIGRKRILTSISPFKTKEERIAFLAKTMKALNDHPELSLEVEEDY